MTDKIDPRWDREHNATVPCPGKESAPLVPAVSGDMRARDTCGAVNRQMQRCTLPPLHAGERHEHDDGQARYHWPIAPETPVSKSSSVVAVIATSNTQTIDGAWWPLLDELRTSHGFGAVWVGAHGLGDEGIELWANTRGLEVERFPAPTELYRRTKRKPADAETRRIVDMLHGERGYQINGRDEVVSTETLAGRPALVVVIPEDQHSRHVAREGAQLGLPVVRLQREPVVINKYHYPEGLPPGAIDVQRGTPLGNPFKAPPKEERSPEAIAGLMAQYEQHVIERLKARDAAVLRALDEIERDSMLACTCKRADGTGPCHADVIVKLWRVGQKRKQGRKTVGRP